MATPEIALIGGTNLLETKRFHNARLLPVATPFGQVTLLTDGQVLFLQRHGLDHYTPPHAINHRANLWALQHAGARKVVAIGSVGSLHRHIPPGTLVVPDDFFAPGVTPSFFDDARSHRPPGFHTDWRRELLESWPPLPAPPPVDGGVYWQTTGPRFETPAEIRFHQCHCHLVGMTIAAECILAGELELPYAALCMVDNYANGIGDDLLSYGSFRQQVQANQSTLLHLLEHLLQTLTGGEP